jgi:hypothetical protein
MEIKDAIAIGTLVVGSFSLLFTIREYIKRGKKDRAEFFLRLRDRFKENELYMTIHGYVESDNHQALETIPTHDLNRLIGFYEEIYLFAQSGFIPKEVLYYMFGQYALDCYQNPTLKAKLGLETAFHWTQFTAFCRDYETWHKQHSKFVFEV